MSVDIRLPFGRFLRLAMNEFRDSRKGSVQAEEWEAEVERAHLAWHQARKPRKRPFQPSKEAEAIYAAYPRKIGREAGLRAIAGALGRIPGDVLLSKVETYARIASRYLPKDHQFIPHCSTWMNEGRWEDDPKEWERPGMLPSKPEAQKAIPEPLNWLEWMRRNMPSWVGFAMSSSPKWQSLDRTSQEAIAKAIRDDPL